MIRIIFLTVIALICVETSASYSIGEIDKSLVDSSKKYPSVPLPLLRALARKESSFNPWALNINGEGYTFDNRKELLEFITRVQDRQWLVKIRLPKSEGKKMYRRYFSTEKEATAFTKRVQQDRSHQGKDYLAFSGSSRKILVGHYGIRNIIIESTDIGLMQINFFHHGKKGQSVSHWLDLNNNVDYAAKFLSILIKTHKDPLIAAGYYHNSDPVKQTEYLKKLKPLYNYEVSKYGYKF